jgi:hypothetical protein
MPPKMRDASELLWPAVAETLSQLNLDSEHAGAAKLAKLYARVIDTSDRHCAGCQDADCERTSAASWAARWIGPLLLDCLEQLGATPAARARLKGGKAADAPVSQLSKLRQARRAGA